MKQKNEKISISSPDYIDDYRSSCDVAQNSPKCDVTPPILSKPSNSLWCKVKLQNSPISTSLGLQAPSTNGGFHLPSHSKFSSKSTPVSQSGSPTKNSEDVSPFRYRILGVLNELKGYVKKVSNFSV